MENETYHNQVKIVYHLLILLFILITIVLVGTYAYLYEDKNVKQEESIMRPEDSGNIILETEIKNQVHISTGLAAGEGLAEVISNCTSCHSAKLIIQNRMSKEMWLGSIRWMQETQNLWELGKNEEVILNYLSTHYAPEEKGRREPLKNIEWYNLTE